jgi:hypothetical protein
MKMFLDVSKPWCILVPEPHKVPSVKILAQKISELRKKAGDLPPDARVMDVPVLDAEQNTAGGAVQADTPIVINYDENSKKTGFAWRVSSERIEIYAHSIISLDNAINDFINNIDGGSPSGTCFPLLKNAHHSF